MTFAGEAGFAHAIVLLFSAPVDVASAAAIRVFTAAGAPVSGQWTASAGNPRMLVFRTAPGRYTVTVPTQVRDSRGTPLATSRSGAVIVHRDTEKPKPRQP